MTKNIFLIHSTQFLADFEKDIRGKGSLTRDYLKNCFRNFLIFSNPVQIFQHLQQYFLNSLDVFLADFENEIKIKSSLAKNGNFFTKYSLYKIRSTIPQLLQFLLSF